MQQDTYDIVIVGGGTAGSVIAARLAERTDLEVALVEAGPSDEDLPEVLQVARWMSLLGGELDYDYAIEEQVRGNSHIRASRARVLGGCSSHNSCIAFRAPDRDLEEWVELGAKGWDPESMAPRYARVRERTAMSVQGVPNAVFDDILAACDAVGLPTCDFNTDAWVRSFPAGAGRFELNVRDGIRMSSSVAYLHPTIDLPDTLDLLTETRVHRVVVDDDGRATGVETDRGPIHARQEVILCAGAIDSPKLLQLSGIGPRDVLSRAGVDTLVDLPVGEHLLDHPEGVVIFGTDGTLPRASTQGWEVGIFATTQQDEDHPDLMFHLGLEPFDEHTSREGYGSAKQGISLTPNVTRARSEGWVRIDSGDPGDRPRIDFRYFTDPDGHDERVMVAGVKLARRIAEQEPLARWLDREVAPGPDVRTDEEISEYVRTTANTVYHPAGTCRMGDPAHGTTVVDPELRVRGVERLRVADASVFPSMTSVNPAITVMAIGERCADLITG